MNNEILVYKDPKSVTAEMFRSLRTNLQYMDKDLKTLLVVSSFPTEGKTWVASNLAVAFAQMGKKVVLIDADMRKGRVNKIFGVNKAPGLSNYLSGKNGKSGEIEKYVEPTEVENLYVLANGDTPENPSELLISEKTVKMFERLKKISDLIIVDGTPCSLVTDSIILSRIVDNTLIVAAHSQTKIEALESLKKNIENVNGKIAGVVVNKMPMSAKEYTKEYYYAESNNGVKVKKMKMNLGITKNVSKEDLKKIDDLKNKVDNMKNDDNDNNEEQVDVNALENRKNEKNFDMLKQINDFLSKK